MKKGRLIYIFTFLMISLCVTTSFTKAAQQNKQYLAEQVQYLDGKALLDKGQFTSSILVLNELLLTKKDMPAVYHTLALSEASNDNVQLASEYMYEVLKLDPHYVDNPSFMLQFSEILLISDEIQKAKQTLEICAAFSIKTVDPQFIERVDELVEYVEERE